MILEKKIKKTFDKSKSILTIQKYSKLTQIIKINSII